MAVAAFAQSLAVAPVFAEESAENNCVCIVTMGTVGQVTGASGWVKLNGAVGLVDATENAPLSLGSVLQTGAAGSASASVGAGCSVDVAALSKMSIVKLDSDRMCVRLTTDDPVVVPNVGLAAAGAAVLGGTLVVVGLGQDEPVSK